MENMNIMVVGVGGQGTLLTSRIIGKTALNFGYDVKMSEVHGMAQRGGSVVTFVRFGQQVSEPVVEEGEVQQTSGDGFMNIPDGIEIELPFM